MCGILNSQPNKAVCFNENELRILIKELQEDKQRYQQEKLAKIIGKIKYEQTADYVIKLLYSDDAYIRNLAIEILVSLGIEALPVLAKKLLDQDRNIRKFVLDVLKKIKTVQSCVIALSALDDPDENVVEAAIEVIAEQEYREATGKLLDLLKRTSSVWILAALIRAFARLKSKGVVAEIETKLFVLPINSLEKGILVDVIVKNLGGIGSCQDIIKLLDVYAVQYQIDDLSLITGLSGMIVNNNIAMLPEKIVTKIRRIFRAYRDFSDAALTLLMLSALVKLQLGFFLKDIKAIVLLHRGEEFFVENLIDVIAKLNEIPSDFIADLLNSDLRELRIMGLKLIFEKSIAGFNGVVEKLGDAEDVELAELAMNIIISIDSYGNLSFIEKYMDINESVGRAVIEGINTLKPEDMEFLLLRLEDRSPKVRKAAAAKLISFGTNINSEKLQEIVWRNRGEAGIEALNVMFRFNEDLAWKYIVTRMNSGADDVRAGMVKIVEGVTDETVFYKFMVTMINDPAATVRKSVIKALNRKPGAESLRLLEQLLTNETVAANKSEIIANLYRFNNAGALDLCVKATENDNAFIRIAAARALGFFNDERVIAILRQLQGDPVEEVRESAEEALNRHEALQ